MRQYNTFSVLLLCQFDVVIVNLFLNAIRVASISTRRSCMSWRMLFNRSSRRLYRSRCSDFQGPSSVYWNHVFHKADFWRVGFHILKRATLAGFECDHTKLGLIWVDLDAMREALEPETVELLDTPLWRVARRPLPRRFQKLFDIDLSTFNQQQ